MATSAHDNADHFHCLIHLKKLERALKTAPAQDNRIALVRTTDLIAHSDSTPDIRNAAATQDRRKKNLPCVGPDRRVATQETVSVPITVLKLIMQDCEAGSRIWCRCNDFLLAAKGEE